MSKKIGKNKSKHLIRKHSQKPIEHAKQFATTLLLKEQSKKKEEEEATGDLIAY